MRRLLRRRVIVPVLIVVAGLFTTGYFLSRSEIAGRLVERKLEERLGTIADFDGAAVGITGTTVTNLRIHERHSGPDSTPFLTVGTAEVNVGAVGAIFDKSPSTIRLQNARVVLRFDKKGDLLTRLPIAVGGDGFPTVQIESGTLLIQQLGHVDSVFHGINLTITSQDQSLTLKGTVHDDAWGKWTAEGTIPMGPEGNGRVTLRTAEPQAVTPELLEQVPLVNPNAWKSVRLAGTTPAQLDLTFDAMSKQLDYRIELAPTKTSADIPNIGLHFVDAHGKLVAKENIVTLTDVRAASAGGGVHVESTLDFSKADSVLRFHADLNGMDVHKLPESWRLPQQIDGRLSGSVDLVVTLPS